MQINNFKGYTLDFTKRASKELNKLEKTSIKKISEKLKDLIKGNPNVDFSKLETPDDATYRLVCGDYRIICEVHNHIITILVIKVAHRREVYRDY
jgi:mRNA interferase RelE/StbE